MAISFNQIPAALRVPGSFLEVDPSLAEVGVGAFPLRALLISQKTTAGTLAINTVQRITSKEQASELAGPGSMGSRMARAWFSVNQSTEFDLVLQNDADGGVPNVQTVTFGGVGAPGGLAIYVGGDRYPIDGSGALTATAIALVAAINADPESSVVAAVNPGTQEQVILTAKNDGLVGNFVDVRAAHLPDETIPSGLTVTIVNTAVGATNPDVTAALAAVAGVQYDVMTHPYLDAANLTVLEADLASRADAMSAIPGLAFTGASGTQGVLAALGNTRNSQFSTIVGVETFPGVPTERAAAVAGLVAKYGAIDPARPFQTLEVPGYAASVADRFTLAERNLLLFDGIATLTADRVGTVTVERLITTYQTNSAGAPSAAYLDVNLGLLLSFFRKAYTARIALRFPRHKLANDSGVAPGPATALATPKVYKAEAVSLYAELVALGICEDLDGFVDNSTIERNQSDVNRIDASLAPNFVNQLRVSATLVQFRL